MIAGLLGRKVGMTHLFVAEGRMVPVTVIQVGPCVVTQLRTQSNDGYQAVQVGYGEARRLNKPQEGHLKGLGKLRHLREFAVDDPAEYTVGQSLDVSFFHEGDTVEVTARSKGKGFQGTIKRHGFSRGPKSHGQKDRLRSPGSIGATTYPGRVLKGKKMSGHMGSERVTTRGLRVERVDGERSLLLVRGSVPGPSKGLVMVRVSRRGPVTESQITEDQVAEDQVAEDQAAEPVAEVEAEPEAVAEEEAPEPVAEVEAEPEAVAEEEAAEGEDKSAEEKA